MQRRISINGELKIVGQKIISMEQCPVPVVLSTMESKIRVVSGHKNASFVRLKNLEIGYTLPNLWFNKLRISNCRVYLSGQNLFTLDHIKYVDPEGSGEGSYYPSNENL